MPTIVGIDSKVNHPPNSTTWKELGLDRSNYLGDRVPSWETRPYSARAQSEHIRTDPNTKIAKSASYARAEDMLPP